MKSIDRLREKDDASGVFGKKVYETLLHGYRPFLSRILFVSVLGIVGRGLLLANANVVGVWVDSFCAAPQTCKPIPSWFQGFGPSDYLILLLIMASVGFVMTLTFRVVFSRLSAQAVSQIYDEVTLRTSRFPMSVFDNTPAGRIITRFSSDYGNVFRLFGGPLAEFLSILFDLLVMILLIGIAGPIYLVFIALVGVCNYFVYRANRDRLRSLRRNLSSSRSPSIAHFAETTQGASTIRSFRRETSFRRRFLRLDQIFLERKLATVGGLISFSFQMNSLSAVLLLTTGLSAIYLVDHGWVTVGSVGVAFTFIAMSGNTIQMFFEWLSQLEEAMIGVERLDRYLRSPIEPGNRLPPRAAFPTGHPVISTEAHRRRAQERLTSEIAASVEIRDLWFRYQRHLPWVLKGLNFRIEPGERLGLIGRTGSGKSSLIQALFRLYPFEKGEILLDGRRARVSGSDEDLDLVVYRRAIAFIAQEPVLFQGPLRSNLDIEGRHDDNELKAVLRRVGLEDWVDTDPAVLERRIEERGKNLSLGERQLLCMARCLLQDAPIVIMDEATSAVDPQSEEILVKATEEFFEGRTQILIAHRLSTLRRCHRILWLDNGEIRRLGPAAEVLEEFLAAAHPELPPGPG